MPLLQEFGVVSFVLVGYLEGPDGKLQRICVANTAKNPAFEDGLRPAIAFANAWGAQFPMNQPQVGDGE